MTNIHINLINWYHEPKKVRQLLCLTPSEEDLRALLFYIPDDTLQHVDKEHYQKRRVRRSSEIQEVCLSPMRAPIQTSL